MGRHGFPKRALVSVPSGWPASSGAMSGGHVSEVSSVDLDEFDKFLLTEINESEEFVERRQTAELGDAEAQWYLGRIGLDVDRLLV